MSETPLGWERNKAQYSNGWDYRPDRFHLGGVHWGMNGGDSPWQATCRLPGLKPVLGNYPTSAEAMAKVEAACERWLAHCGLVRAPGVEPGASHL